MRLIGEPFKVYRRNHGRAQRPDSLQHGLTEHCRPALIRMRQIGKRRSILIDIHIVIVSADRRLQQFSKIGSGRTGEPAVHTVVYDEIITVSEQ